MERNDSSVSSQVTPVFSSSSFVVDEGFTVQEVAQAVRARVGWTGEHYPARRAAYDLAKLRGKGLVERVSVRRCYDCRAEKLRVRCA